MMSANKTRSSALFDPLLKASCSSRREPGNTCAQARQNERHRGREHTRESARERERERVRESESESEIDRERESESERETPAFMHKRKQTDAQDRRKRRVQGHQRQ
jgi:hypothetical protein